jgi:hypothetical protein
MSDAAATSDIGSLMLEFESLGDNCEFGLVQRRAGVEPMGLFRFAFSRIDTLEAALRASFRGFENIEVSVRPDGEIIFTPVGYSFTTHTWSTATDSDLSEHRARLSKRNVFLRERLLALLETGERIFVRKGSRRDEIDRLHAALRSYGPNILLWVTGANYKHPPGTVEMIAPGLLRGYVDRFAPYDQAADFSFECWVSVCRAAFALRAAAAAALSAAALSFADAPATDAHPRGAVNLIHEPAYFGGSFEPLEGAAATLATHIPAMQDGAAVMMHRIAGEGIQLVFHHFIPEGVIPGAPCRMSFWVWVPSIFSGSLVVASINGFPRLADRPADLSQRDCWQHVWCVASTPEHIVCADPSLLLNGKTGDVVYTTSWDFVAGPLPHGTCAQTSMNSRQGGKGPELQ